MEKNNIDIETQKIVDELLSSKTDLLKVFESTFENIKNGKCDLKDLVALEILSMWTKRIK